MIPRRAFCQHTGGLQTVGQGSIGDNDGFQFRGIPFNAVQFINYFGQLPSREVYGSPADPAGIALKPSRIPAREGPRLPSRCLRHYPARQTHEQGGSALLEGQGNTEGEAVQPGNR
jgi:hypothetical protein